MADALDALLDEAVAACARAWPDVTVDRERLRERLAGLDTANVDRAHLGELALAIACLAHDAAALRVFDKLVRAEAQRAIGELRKPAWLVDEVHQELSRRLLVDDGDRPARLAQYAGQSALGRWLGVAAMRTALNLTRKDGREAALADDDRDEAVLAAVVAPELALVRERYRSDVEYAIRAAFDSLDTPRDRNLLRMYYLERVGLDRLGVLFGVHASTVSRWLRTLRDTIIEDARNRLAERLGFAGNYGDLDSLMRAVQSDLDLTLSRILRPSA